MIINEDIIPIKKYYNNGLEINLYCYDEIINKLSKEKMYKDKIDLKRTIDYAQSSAVRTYDKLASLFNYMRKNSLISSYKSIKKVDFIIIFTKDQEKDFDIFQFNNFKHSIRMISGDENENYNLIYLYKNIILVENLKLLKKFKKKYIINEDDFNELYKTTANFFAHFIYANELLGFQNNKEVKDYHLYRKINSYYKNLNSKTFSSLFECLLDNFENILPLIKK
jgi:hypothetical protein